IGFHVCVLLLLARQRAYLSRPCPGKNGYRVRSMSTLARGRRPLTDRDVARGPADAAGADPQADRTPAAHHPGHGARTRCPPGPRVVECAGTVEQTAPPA